MRSKPSKHIAAANRRIGVVTDNLRMRKCGSLYPAQPGRSRTLPRSGLLSCRQQPGAYDKRHLR
jgi:hypothetical protein